MSGRAKGKLFVIRGKERLDVGLQEDEFLLQAVFYCMGAGPNPDCRAPMLAPRRRQSLISPSCHANSPAQIPPAGRPKSRPAAVHVGAPSAGKTLSHRRTTLTGRPESRLPGAHVGALRRQNLIPPPGHANSPAQIPLAGRPCWRPSAVKTLCHRRATPTVRSKSRLPAAHVGVVRLRRDSFLYGNL